MGDFGAGQRSACALLGLGCCLMSRPCAKVLCCAQHATTSKLVSATLRRITAAVAASSSCTHCAPCAGFRWCWWTGANVGCRPQRRTAVQLLIQSPLRFSLFPAGGAPRAAPIHPPGAGSGAAPAPGQIEVRAAHRAGAETVFHSFWS